MPHSTQIRQQARASQRLATVVALGAITLFAMLSARVVPAALFDVDEMRTASRLLVPPLLTAALILLAWRRAAESRALHEELEASRARELRLAYFDETTNLHNRRYLMKEILSRVRDERVIFLLLDLDGFKQVNDLYGHEAGDALLRGVADRLSELVPSTADVVRLGGDEFAVCFRGDDTDEGKATKLANQLVTAIGQPFPLAGTIARVGVSIGLSSREDSGELVTTVLQRSDIAMYEAKRLGKNCAVWFDADMERVRTERSKAEAEIRVGIERGEFVPHFQPLLDLASLRVRGFEVLARWVHPRRGTLGPDAFLEVAEGSGLIAELSISVMRSAFAQAVHWPSELAVAVNISRVQFKDPLLADRLLALLRESGFPPARLEIEVSEHSLLHDNQQTLATIQKLKAAGARISLDDFGTGYAALSQFREMPFDRIKIDRNFVSSLRSDKHSDAIVHAIAALGKTLSLPITAEGIEEETIQDFLVTLGATEGQGWLYGKALPGEEAAREYLEIEPVQLPVSARSVRSDGRSNSENLSIAPFERRADNRRGR